MGIEVREREEYRGQKERGMRAERERETEVVRKERKQLQTFAIFMALFWLCLRKLARYHHLLLDPFLPPPPTPHLHAKRGPKEKGRGSLLGVTLTNCFGALFYRRFYANWLCILYSFFGFVGLQFNGFSSGLWQFDIFNQNLLIIYLWLWASHTNDVFWGDFSFGTLSVGDSMTFWFAFFFGGSYGFIRIIGIILMIWIIGLMSISWLPLWLSGLCGKLSKWGL